MKIINTYFLKKGEQKWTRRSLNGDSRNKVNYILVIEAVIIRETEVFDPSYPYMFTAFLVLA